jgi:Carboxypeptidase regulatory-like domain
MASVNVIHRSAAILFIATLLACSSTQGPTAPTPAPARPNVTITSISIVGESDAGGGYTYRAIVHLREAAGAAATIQSVDLTFMSATTRIVSSRHERPISDGANVCPASGTIATRELTTQDGDASHPYAATVQATVTFSDGAAFVASTSASADVPPMGGTPPLPPETFTLTGRITDISTHAVIAGARLEILGGLNGGTIATSGGDGTYLMQGLLADSFRMRASADGYDPGEQGVTVPTVPRADFELRRAAPAACAYSVAPTGPVSVSFVGGQFSMAITRTGGSCAWRATSDAAWLSLSNSAGADTATTTVVYQTNALFVGRAGTVTVDWGSGSAQVIVRQAAETPAFCRIVTVTVGGQSIIAVSAGGGQFTASITPEPAVPPGVCGPWTATASAGITLVGPGSGPAAPASVTFVVQPNLQPAPRSLQVMVSFGSGGPSPWLTVNQAGAP